MTTTLRAPLISPTEVLGSRLLSDLSSTSETLESLLTTLRTTTNPTPSPSGIPALDALWLSSSSPSKPPTNTKLTTTNPTTTNPINNLRKLTLSSRSLPLLYHIISTILSTKTSTLVLLDLDRRFSPSHLPLLSSSDLSHLHVFRPTTKNLAATIAGLEEYMLHGDHRSKGREWKGVFVSGTMAGLGEALKGLKRVPVVQAGWRGWMRVEREEVPLFAEEMAVEEAWGEREGRRKAVDAKGWRGVCEGGEFRWD